MRSVLFGKMPTQGDFIRLGPDTDLLGRIDAWLTSAWSDFGLIADPHWEARYRTAPLWRFVLPLEPHQCLLGLLSPSLDAVGRLFPLVVAARVQQADRWSAFRRHANWLAQVENAVIDALEPPGLGPEALLEAVPPASAGDDREIPMSLIPLELGIQPGYAYFSQEGWDPDRGVGFAAAPGWSFWQSFAIEGRSHRALHLQGWPSAAALGWLMAFDAAASPQPAHAAPQQAKEPASPSAYRLELAHDVLSLPPQSFVETTHSLGDKPLLACAGGRGIFLLAPDAAPLSSPGWQHLGIILHGIAGPRPLAAAEVESAVKELVQRVPNLVAAIRADDGWLLCRTGSRLQLGLSASGAGKNGFHRIADAGDFLTLRWGQGAPAAVEVVDNRAGGASPSTASRLGAMLRQAAGGTPQGRRVALLELNSP